MKQVLRSSLVHGPNYFLPPGVEGGVITVHDLSVFRYPETHPAARVRAFEKLFKSSLDRSAHIITDTDTIRREVIETFSVPPEMVTAVHLGVDHRFKPTDKSSAALASWGLATGKYGLCVSTLEPRKRILELLLAWERLPSELRLEYPLVLAGGSGWENEALHKEIGRGTAEGWLRLLGFRRRRVASRSLCGRCVVHLSLHLRGVRLASYRSDGVRRSDDRIKFLVSPGSLRRRCALRGSR